GWPSATAPPFTFTRAGSMPSSLITATDCTENASLISYRSTSSGFHPVLAQSLRMPSTAAIITHSGAVPLVASPTMRTIGCGPSCLAREPEVTTTAADPSFIVEALPAVTVPSFLNTGFKFASDADEVSSRGPSSLSNSVDASPFFLAGSSTGTIWLLKRHSFHACTALQCELTAYSSCCSRVTPYFCATFSPV